MTILVKAGVRVPCSTSNLGAGFDTVGLALDRYLQATFEPGGSELVVKRAGTLEALGDPGPEQDLLVSTFLRTLADAEAPSPVGVLDIQSQIPVARGLGSSAAALVAGHDLARAVLGLPPDPRSSFRYAREREGHGDNAAPCAFGGLRAVVQGAAGVRALSLDLSPDVGFAYAAPSSGLSTARTRAALPLQIPHSTAVAQLGSLAALIRGLALGDPELLRLGMEDALHVPHRMHLIPGAYAAVEAGYSAGAWAVTISGSGSGLIAMAALRDAEEVAHAMCQSFTVNGNDPDCVGFALHPDFQGATRLF